MLWIHRTVALMSLSMCTAASVLSLPPPRPMDLLGVSATTLALATPADSPPRSERLLHIPANWESVSSPPERLHRYRAIVTRVGGETNRRMLSIAVLARDRTIQHFYRILPSSSDDLHISWRGPNTVQADLTTVDGRERRSRSLRIQLDGNSTASSLPIVTEGRSRLPATSVETLPGRASFESRVVFLQRGLFRLPEIEMIVYERGVPRVQEFILQRPAGSARLAPRRIEEWISPPALVTTADQWITGLEANVAGVTVHVATPGRFYGATHQTRQIVVSGVDQPEPRVLLHDPVREAQERERLRREQADRAERDRLSRALDPRLRP